MYGGLCIGENVWYVAGNVPGADRRRNYGLGEAYNRKTLFFSTDKFPSNSVLEYPST